jgi:hypothetical protein
MLALWQYENKLRLTMGYLLIILVLIAGATAPENYQPADPRGANGPAEQK